MSEQHTLEQEQLLAFVLENRKELRRALVSALTQPQDNIQREIVYQFYSLLEDAE